MTNVDLFLGRLSRVQEVSGRMWLARCPTCGPDSWNPTLKVWLDSGNNFQVRCGGGCAASDLRKWVDKFKRD
jgi:hypothetical protein